MFFFGSSTGNFEHSKVLIKWVKDELLSIMWRKSYVCVWEKREELKNGRKEDAESSVLA